jgi:cbb3-type cytochrome oxidase maturation protein
MEAMIILIVIVALLVGLDLAAATWGVDSRPSLRDDHNR